MVGGENKKKTYVTPVPITSRRQTLETFHQQNAGIANFTLTWGTELETFDEIGFIFFRVCET